MKEEEKEKYSAFITEVSEILGIGKPGDIIKLCIITDNFFKPYQKRIVDLEGENKLIKSFLYCTERSCNNCGKVNCENFQRQRIDCCGLWVSFKDYISKLETENAELVQEKYNLEYKIENLENKIEHHQEVIDVFKKELAEAKEIINAFLDFEASAMERGCYIADDTRRRAEDFIKE